MKKFFKKLIPNFVFSGYHFLLAFLGALIYAFPSRKMKVIGVTGTKGKSTVVFLAGKVLEEKYRNKVGWISSLSIKIGEKEFLNPYHMTMPGRFYIQKMLAQMAKAGCQYALIETTSEGIKQYRHKFINFSGAVFTNLAPEHLEAHGGFENYRAEKVKLFKAVSEKKNSFGIYNLDDENVKYFLEAPIRNKFGYFLENGSGEMKKIQISKVGLSAQGSEFKINNVNFKTQLLGEFNVYNCAAAAAIGLAQGVSLEETSMALEKIKSIPGRLELIEGKQDFSVIVDLAHTPDSYEKVFGLFKSLPYNRIITVFGSAGGGRDKWKRPELGRIASENSDIAIITNEDSYDENPQTICEEIAAGCKKTKPEIIIDRCQAIAKALRLAQKNDIVLILGKGTEQTMVLSSGKIDWDDRKVAREELGKMNL